MNRTPVIAVLPILAALGLSACGGSAPSTSSASATAAAPTAPATSASAAPGGASAATTATHTAAAIRTPVAIITTKHQGKLGTVLAFGPKRLTVYLFEDDHGRASACAGACAKAWPPVLGQPRAAGGAHAADLGTIRRAGGARQVTYHGHPLYLFIKDKDAGDAYGEGLDGFGAGWYVLRPSGARVEEDDNGKRSSSRPSPETETTHHHRKASRPSAPPRSSAPSRSRSATTPAARPRGPRSSTAVAIAAAPSGQLAFTRSSLTTSSGPVTIHFTNSAPESHNFTLERAGSGPVLAATPTFQGGTRSITVHLAPGTYTFFCSVPGHRMAGMHGTLTVR